MGLQVCRSELLLGLVSGYRNLESEVFDTSETKLIDNAIVEYVVSTLGKRPSGGHQNRGV